MNEIAAPVTSVAEPLLTVPVANPKSTLPISIMSVPMPAHRALLISRLPPSGSFLSPAVQSNSPHTRSRPPKSRGNTAYAAGTFIQTDYSTNQFLNQEITMIDMNNVQSPVAKRGATKQVAPNPTRRAARTLTATLDVEFMLSSLLASFAGRSGSF